MPFICLAESYKRLLLVFPAFFLSAMLQAEEIDISVLFDMNLEQLNNVLISVRKREESIAQTPASVLIFQQSALNSAFNGSMHDLILQSPAAVDNPDNILEANLFIRGAGSDIESSTSNAAIGFYQDNHYLPRNSGYSFPLFDVSHVEMLKGPQGALYGKNVSGGVINIVTHKPVKESVSELSISRASFEELLIQGMTNGEVSENSQIRLSFFSRNNDGYSFNTHTQQGMDDVDQQSIRLQWLWQGADKLRILTFAELSRQKNNGHWVDMNIPSANNQAFKNADARAGPNNLSGISEADMDGAYIQIDKQWSEWQLSATSSYRQGDFFHSNNDAGSYIDFTRIPLDHNSGRIDFAHPDYDPSQFNDDFFINNKQESYSMLSQEFIFSSDQEAPLAYRITALMMAEHVDREESPEYVFGQFYSQGMELSRSESDNYTLILGGEVIYQISPQWRSAMGLQYNYDKKSYHIERAVEGDPLGAPLMDAQGNATDHFFAEDKNDWQALTPSLILQWQGNNNMHMYWSYAQGFRSGGWNDEGITSPQEALVSYDEELAHNIEWGWHNQSDDASSYRTISLFYTLYDQLQTQQFQVFDENISPDNVIANVSEAIVTGVDISAQKTFFQRLNLAFNYSYMYSKINDDLIETNLSYDPGCDCLMPTFTNLKGNQLRRTPEHSLSLRSDWQFLAGANMDGFWNISYFYTGDYFLDNNNNDRTEIEGFGLINSHIQFSSQDRRWSLWLWGKNLSNERYKKGITDVLDSVLVSYGAPRSFGLTLSWKHR
ncbi:MAG: TonB-dependent receptor [Pseudomonadales bacterium]|nr:TonB-dependent receptor [Pseudomonadales bacterium]